jgi:DNA-binding protein H-NS
MSFDVLNEREKEAVLHRIRTLMEFWGITPEELEREPERPKPLPVVEKTIKYRHPVSGESWDGDGDHPEWLRKALLKEGFTVDELKRAALSS